MGTRIVVMKDGYIQQVDTPQNIYNYPSNIFVARFMGSPQMNFFDGKVVFKGDKAYATLDDQMILLPETSAAILKKENLDGKLVTFGIRPENLDDDKTLVAENPTEVIDVDIEVIELMGAESYVYGKSGNASLTIRMDGTTELKVGQKAKMHLDASKIHVFNKETELRVI